MESIAFRFGEISFPIWGDILSDLGRYPFQRGKDISPKWLFNLLIVSS